MTASFANSENLAFYREMPFNYRSTVEEAVGSIRDCDESRLYPGLHGRIGPETRVLEVGCGIGWLSNSISHLYGAPVVGVDFNPVAIELASRVASELELPARFVVSDLFRFEPDQPFDLVISFGALHCTNNCPAAVRHCIRFVRPGGHLVIGLNHRYGREPFLEHFAAMRKGGATEEEVFERYRELHAAVTDETQLRSWFRDQLQIPHESLHTLEEMVPILQSEEMELVSTSINHFEPFEAVDPLYDLERAYREISRQRIEEGRFFPGFFIFVARKVAKQPAGP